MKVLRFDQKHIQILFIVNNRHKKTSPLRHRVRLTLFIETIYSLQAELHFPSPASQDPEHSAPHAQLLHVQLTSAHPGLLFDIAYTPKPLAANNAATNKFFIISF